MTFLQKYRGLLPLLALLLALCGCSSFLDSEYEQISDHDAVASDNDDEDESDVVTVSTYTGLKNAILTMVKNGKETGTIRLQNYDGEPAEDISKAISEVGQSTPFGAYAVDYFDHDKAQILSYYELYLTINYKRTAKQIGNIISTYSTTQAEEILREAVSESDTYLAILSSSGIASESFIYEYLEGYYYENPLQMLLLPEISINIYPESGSQRIAEIEFTYGDSAVDISDMLEELNARAESLSEETKAMSTSEGVRTILLCASLSEVVVPESEVNSEEQTNIITNTAYGALVGGVSDSEGYAMAFKALCDLMDIECYVVAGQLAEQSHFWNIVNIDGSYYHVDPIMCDVNGIETAFLLSDSAMLGEEYKWNTENYVLCEGTLTYYDFAGFLTDESTR